MKLLPVAGIGPDRVAGVAALPAVALFAALSLARSPPLAWRVLMFQESGIGDYSVFLAASRLQRPLSGFIARDVLSPPATAVWPMRMSPVG